MGDTATLFRLVCASALIGLLVYCSLHVLQVWRKRNARAADGTARTPSGRKLAWACLLGGFVLTPAAIMLRELTQAEGVLTGDNLFVVRAREESTVEWLQNRDEVAIGEPLARLGSVPRSARAEEARARLARAEAEEQVLALLPLTQDPELTRRLQGVAQERSQVQQELGQAVSAAEAADRDLTAQLQTKKEALARLERTLTERRKDLERATIRANHAREMAPTYAELRARGTISGAEYQDHQKSLLEATAEMTALAQEMKDGLAEKELLRGHLEKLDKNRNDQTTPAQKQTAGLRARLAKLENEEADMKKRLDRDLDRSAKLREAEKAQAAAHVREQRASLSGLVGEQDIRAPFAGRIAYRAASPNAVRQQGTLLVLGPDNGFLLTARLGKTEADALRDGGEVMLEVGEDGPERRMPARFRKSSALTHEPDHSALQLECQPPPEMVRRLAEGEKLTVAFAWRPPLTGMWPFRVGVLLIPLGFFGLYLTRDRPAGTAVRLLSRFAGPRPGPSVQDFGQRRAKVRDSHVVADSLAAVEGIHSSQSVDQPALTCNGDVPDTLNELEELCRETLEQLNRAESTADATRLLDRLHRIRRALRTLDLPFAAPIASRRTDQNRPIAGAGS